MNSNTDYVPYSLSDHIFQTFKSGRKRKGSTPAELQQVVAVIESLVADLYLPESELLYTNILYPHIIAKTLLLSRTDKWPDNYDIDEIIEFMISRWLKETIVNPTDYMNQLWTAIKKLQCEIGMKARLNVDAISSSIPDRITISTKHGAITQEQINRRSLNSDVKLRIKHLLGDEFTSNINAVYNKISSLHRSYTLEQTLLSWIGYMVVRVVIAAAPAPITFKDRLLIAESPKRLDISGPSSSLQTPE